MCVRVRAFKFFIVVVDVVWMMHVGNIACSFDRTEKLLAALMISADEIHLHRFPLVCASFLFLRIFRFVVTLPRFIHTYVRTYVCVLCVFAPNGIGWKSTIFDIQFGQRTVSIVGGDFESNNTFAVGRLLNEIVH